jgi:ribosomal protein L10
MRHDSRDLLAQSVLRMLQEEDEEAAREDKARMHAAVDSAIQQSERCCIQHYHGLRS